MCQFGMAIVDTPKGDLDSSMKITGAGIEVVPNSQKYPYGTAEMYANMVDSKGNVLSNTGHEYVECSNKGICNRETGLCKCVQGFSGSACQNMQCPTTAADTSGSCNGHGVCLSAYELAKLDSNNIYQLWDKDLNKGCLCDPGYNGANCNYRTCKVGFDPLFNDAASSRRFSNWSYAIITKSPSATVIGNYSIKFQDYYGQSRYSDPIPYGAPCRTIVKLLEMMPNQAIPLNSVRCLQFLDFSKIPRSDEPGMARGNPYYGIKYTLAFPQNPGILKDIELEIYLDGSRPTLYDATPLLPTPATALTYAPAPLKIVVYPNGFSGEDVEYFTERCLGVDVTLRTAPLYDYFSGLTELEFRLLSRCLGNADGMATTSSAAGRVQGKDYTWDYGSKFYPHLIRLVDNTLLPMTDLCTPSPTFSTLNTSQQKTNTRTGNKVICNNDKPPSGFFAAIFYDPVSKLFKLYNRPASDYGVTTTFTIFTTKGTASMVTDFAKIYTNDNDPYSKTIYSTNSSARFKGYNGNIDCLTNGPLVNGAVSCLEKGNKVFFLDPNLNSNSIITNPKYFNLYTIAKISMNPLNIPDQGFGSTIVLDMGINAAYKKNKVSTTIFDEARAYIFNPLSDNQDPSYTYVAQCSNRGNCNPTTGLCACFEGYEGDSCQVPYNIV